MTFVPCDVTQPEQFTRCGQPARFSIDRISPSRLFDECEKYFGVSCVDLLVNNAGINTNLGWRKCMEVTWGLGAVKMSHFLISISSLSYLDGIDELFSNLLLFCM